VTFDDKSPFLDPRRLYPLICSEQIRHYGNPTRERQIFKDPTRGIDHGVEES